MSRTLSLRQIILSCLLFVLTGLLGWGISPAREMLLFVNNGGYLFYCLQLLPTGQLVWTGQTIEKGNDAVAGFAISPDQRYLWSSYSDSTSQGLEQYQVSPNGLISTTGHFVQLSGIPYDIMFTPNGQILVSDGGPIFRVNSDSSIQSTSDVYLGDLNISPRGDINYSRTTYPPAFRIDKIDSSSAIITTLEVITTSDQPEYQAVYRPAGDYIAYVYFDGFPAGVEVRHVLSNGILDTTQVWDYSPGAGIYLDITPDGNHIYANGISHLNWSNQSSMFVDSGETNPVSGAYQIKVSPDGNFLVVVVGQTSLKTFAIQPDGSLVDTGYTFDFGNTFGNAIPGGSRLIFDWTPLPTSVPEELWRKLDDE